MKKEIFKDKRKLVIQLNVNLEEEINYHRKTHVQSQSWKDYWGDFIQKGSYHIIENQILRAEKLVLNILMHLERIWKRDKAKVFQKIPEIEFILERGEEKIGTAQVENEDIMKGLNLIHFNIFNILSEDSMDIDNQNVIDSFERLLIHETTHLVQFQSNYYRQLSAALQGVADKYYNLPTDNTELDNLFWEERIWIMNFFRNLIIEGMARFCQDYGKLDFTDSFFNKNYSVNLDIGKELIKIINEKIDSICLSKKGKSYDNFPLYNDPEYPYLIGEHMILNILYSGMKKEVAEIIELKLFGFIRLYESAAESLHKRPIISVNSGKGILDYNIILKKFYAAYKSGIKI